MNDIDRRHLKTHLGLGIGCLAFLGTAAFLIAPGKATRAQKSPFVGRNFAHRGLHKIDKSVPENSLPAFEAAARIGYGVELDVHLTADGELVVFHDDDLNRVCGVDASVGETAWPELRDMRLCGTNERIPLLSEALAVIRNRCPLIVELKRGRHDRELCRKTCAMLREYGGRYCIESFDPFIVGWFRLHAPEVLRGQLASNPIEMAKGTGKLNAFLIGNVLLNFISRPQFIAYGLERRKPLTVKLAEMMGAMKVAWTSREWKTEETNDAVIFQFYRPRVKYK